MFYLIYFNQKYRSKSRKILIQLIYVFYLKHKFYSINFSLKIKLMSILGDFNQDFHAQKFDIISHFFTGICLIRWTMKQSIDIRWPQSQSTSLCRTTNTHYHGKFIRSSLKYIFIFSESYVYKIQFLNHFNFINFSTIQFFDHSTIQLFYYCTIQLFNYPTIQLSNYSNIQLFNFPTILLSNYPAIKLFNYLTIRLFYYSNYPTIQLFKYSTIQLSNYSTIQLSSY